ncbi:MAG TPA: SDR family oxidoreductase [Candidatus Limnocylindria bacterium]|nr:SDR family oxidoreductase [Candidatus Limnocylindria bacterium]
MTGPGTALITGGSRGIGAATARELASRGFDVAFTYRNKKARADEVAADVERAGGAALAIAADITGAAALRSLAAAVRDWRGRIDLLVLNASGGLERDLLAADPDYPMRINRDAQNATVDALLPLLARPATIVFVTSHWAHLFGTVAQLPDYEPVARSKRAGEDLLRARIGTLAERGIRLLVVTGDLVEGTITARLLERRARGLHDARAEELVTAEVFARAIADAALDPTLASGATVVVGGPLASVPRS